LLQEANVIATMARESNPLNPEFFIVIQ
jgi:hypothetical protein